MKRIMIMAALAIGMAAVSGGASAQGYVRHTHGGGGYVGGGYRRVPMYPQYPIHHHSGRFDGFNPAGGIDTSGVTVHNTVNDPFREMSRFNGSAQNVSHPVFDASGRIVGYRQGVQWKNSVTGQTHFEGQTITNNGLGGVNTQMQFRSARNSGQ